MANYVTKDGEDFLDTIRDLLVNNCVDCEPEDVFVERIDGFSYPKKNELVCTMASGKKFKLTAEKVTE